MRAGVDLGDDVEDGAVGADDEGPALGVRPTLMNDTVRRRNQFVGIAQHRIIEVEGLGEARVGRRRITARGKEDDIETTESGVGRSREVHFLAAFELDDERFGTPAGTQRVALAGSTTGKGLGEPG